MSPFFRKKEEEIVAVFDIGNGSIGGALVKLTAHGLPVILYTHREPITFVQHPSSKYLLSSMLKLLRVVAQHLAKDGMAHISKSPFGMHKLALAYCVFASPWYMSQTKVIREDHEQAFLISRKTLDELVEKEQQAFNAALKEGKYQQIFGPDTLLFEKRIINTKLNGYNVEDPVGKHARELELTLFTSYISEEILGSVDRMIHGAFRVRTIEHFSYGLVLWNATQIISPNTHDYFFFDVSGETTDIALVVRSILIETISFPMGRAALLRQVVKDFDTTADIALSFLTMYFQGELDASFKEKLATILKPIEEDWRDQCMIALKQFQKIYALPSVAFMTADLDTSGFFLKALESECDPELNLPNNRLSKQFIGAETVSPHVETLPGNGLDSFVAIESIFLNNHFSHH